MLHQLNKQLHLEKLDRAPLKHVFMQILRLKLCLTKIKLRIHPILYDPISDPITSVPELKTLVSDLYANSVHPACDFVSFVIKTVA